MLSVKSHKFDPTEGLAIQLLTTKCSHLSRRLNANCALGVTRGDEGVPHSYLYKCKELLKPPTLRPLALAIPYFFLLILGGMNSIRPFVIHVFRELGMKNEASWMTVS
jgi:hypothetical protein